MNAIEIALRRAAEKSDSTVLSTDMLDKIQKDAEERKAAEEEERRRAEAQRQEEEAMRIRKERDKAANANRKKNLYGWAVIPEPYCCTSGILWADNIDEAKRIINNRYSGALSVSVYDIDLAETMFVISDHYE